MFAGFEPATSGNLAGHDADLNSTLHAYVELEYECEQKRGTAERTHQAHVLSASSPEEEERCHKTGRRHSEKSLDEVDQSISLTRRAS